MDEHVLRTYRRQEPVFVHGTGALIYDQAGKEYLDFLGGIAVSALGHGHQRLVAELHDQLTKLIHVSNLYRHPYTEQVATRLAELSGMAAVFFANSGTEANEAALKIARKYHLGSGRTGYVALEGSFHGRTLGALSVTHTEKYRKPFEPLIPGVTFVAPGDIPALEAALNQKPAALILEPIQGESGIREVPVQFLRAARQLCDRTDTLLIHDEVQCGSGRTGSFLYGQQLGIRPDIATLAKPLAAGLPMGACLVTEKLLETLQPGDHGSTFAGGPLVLRGALVFLDELQRGLLATVQERGRQLRAGLEALRREFSTITELRGCGLIQGLRVGAGAPELQSQLFDLGLIVNVTGGDVIRLLPPFVITAQQIARGIELLRKGLTQLRSHQPANPRS